MSKKSPQIRFEGFTDDWEERKLSDVANHRGGTAIEKYFDKDGVYKVISIGSYGLNSQYVDQNIRAISNEITDGRVVNSGELTMVLNDKTANGTIIGRSLLVEKDNEYVINQRTEIISPKENFDSNFAYTIINGPFREKVKRIVQGGTQIYVNYPAVSNLNLELPKIEEQKKIGSFFKQLDDTIALHQRKLDLLKEQKKGYLQKMFPKNGSKIPELRFAGFADDWEQCKLSDITKRVIRKNKNLESTLPLTISAQEGLIDQNEFFNKTIASRDVSGYYLIKNGEFAYNKSYSNGYPWGAVKRLNRYNMGVLSTLYIVFKPTNIDSDFLEKYYDTTYWHKEISKHAAEGARNHGLLNIAATDFFKTELVISKSLEEQQKIGSFFQQLDNTITLHQRKLDLLKEQKKGYLQKMFPKNGAKVPELRFAGFADDWEERKLKDVTERVRSNDGRMDLPTLTMSASSGWLDQKDRFSGDISGKEKKNYTLLKKGELSYNHGNSKLAKYGVVFSLTNYEEALVPRVYHSFKALENTSADFIEYMFSTKLPDRELGKLISSGARMDGLLNINYDDFMNIHISIPNYEEQILMSAFFRKLDENIALHQRKLDLLKEQKKGYLQKMFV